MPQVLPDLQDQHESHGIQNDIRGNTTVAFGDRT
jgi:hypothetical protein